MVRPTAFGRHRAEGRRPRASVDYRRILVPLADNPEAGRAMDVACRLASERHASITAVTVIEVPRLLPLDAHMVEEEDDARRLLGRAASIAASYGVGVSTRIVRSRDAASAIVEQAEAGGAKIVVIGGARKSGRTARSPIFGSTLQEVLKKSPCRVMVVASPPTPRPGQPTAPQAVTRSRG